MDINYWHTCRKYFWEHFNHSETWTISYALFIGIKSQKFNLFINPSILYISLQMQVCGGWMWWLGKKQSTLSIFTSPLVRTDSALVKVDFVLAENFLCWSSCMFRSLSRKRPNMDQLQMLLNVNVKILCYFKGVIMPCILWFWGKKQTHTITIFDKQTVRL